MFLHFIVFNNRNGSKQPKKNVEPPVPDSEKFASQLHTPWMKTFLGTNATKLFSWIGKYPQGMKI